MKHSAPTSIKFLKLKRRLNLPHWQIVGLLESLWLFTQANAPSGEIGRHANEDIAAAIEWSGDADTLIKHLVECRWLDPSEEHRLVVHDWADHCPNYVKGGIAKRNKSKSEVQASSKLATSYPQASSKLATENQGGSLQLELQATPKLATPLPNLTKPNLTKPEDSSSEPPPATREHEGDGANAKPKKTHAPKPTEPPDDSPIVLTFPVVGDPAVPTWDLRASQVEAWSKLFPGVNVTHECRKALGWIQVNPAKTKTARGMPKFLYSWLERETNRGNVMPRSRQPALPMPISSYDTNTLNNSASEV